MRKTFKWGVQVKSGKDVTTECISLSRHGAEVSNDRIYDGKGKVVRVLCLI